MPNQSLYVNSIGATDDWNTSSNITGSEDGSCGSSTKKTNQVELVFAGFTDLGDGDEVLGFEVDVWWASSDADDYITVTLDTGYGTAPTVKNLGSGGTNTNCSGVVQETEGSSTDMWGYTASTITGDHVNDASDLTITLEHVETAKGGDVYVDAVQVTVYYARYIKLELDAGIGISATKVKKVKKALDAGIGISAEHDANLADHYEIITYPREYSGGASWSNHVDGLLDIDEFYGIGATNCSSVTSISEVELFFVPMSVPRRAVLKGIKVEVMAAISSTANNEGYSFRLASRYGNGSSVTQEVTHTSTCADAGTYTHGGLFDLSTFGLPEVTYGEDINDMDFHMVFNKYNGSTDTLYIQAIRITLNVYIPAADVSSVSAYCSTATSSDWSNPTNAQGASDGSCATASSVEIMKLYYSGFSSIPDNAHIIGMKHEADVCYSDDGTSRFPVTIYSPRYLNDPTDTDVNHRLIDVEMPEGANCAATSVVTKGGIGQGMYRLWGLSGKDLKDSDFHLYLHSGNNTGTIYLDSYRLTVYYTEYDQSSASYWADTVNGALGSGFSNTANITGADDGSCTTSSSVDDDIATYPDLSATLTDKDRITGIEIKVKRACSSSGTDAIKLLMNPEGALPEEMWYALAVQEGPDITDTTDCTAVAWETFGGPNYTWGMGELIGEFVRTTNDLQIVITHTQASNTLYIDAVQFIVYYNQVASVTKYIKTGGATGAFTNDSNLEGTADSTCASSVLLNEETCYPDAFTTLPADSPIYGIEIEYKVARSTASGDVQVEKLSCAAFGDDDVPAQGGGHTLPTSTCSDSTWQTPPAGGKDFRWWHDHVTGGDLDGTDLYFVLDHYTGTGETIYWDAARVTIYYESTGTLFQKQLSIGVGIGAGYLKDMTKTLDAGVGVSGTYNKSLTKKLAAGLGISATASAIKKIYLYLSAGLGIASTKTKSITKALAAGLGINSAATAARTAYLNLTAGLGVSATYLKSLKKTLAAGLGINAATSLARTAYINVAAGIGVSATKLKNITKALSAGIGVSATATAIKKVYLYLSAGLGISGTVAKSITKKLAAGLGISASATAFKTVYMNLSAGLGINAAATALRTLYLNLSAGIGISSVVSTLRTAYINIAAGIGINASATALKTAYLYLAAGVGISATKVKNITKALAAGIGISGTATALRTAYIAAAAGIGISVTKIKNIKKVLSAGVGINAFGDATVAIFLYLNAGIGISVSYAKSLTKSLAIGVGVSAQKVKNITKVLSAGVGINASTILTKTKQLLLNIGIGISSTYSKSLKKVLSAGLGINASVTALKTVFLNLSAGIGISATKVKNITKALAAGIGVSTTKAKNITKALAAGIGINAAGIATKIGGVLKNLYLDIGIGISAAKKKDITKVLAIGVGVSSTVTAFKTVYMALSAGIGISAAATALKTMYLALSAGLGISVTKTKSITKALAVGVGVSAAQTKNLLRKLAAGIGISSTAPKTVGKKVAAGLGISVSKVKSITKALSVGIGVSATKIKNISKKLSVGIGISSSSIATAFQQFFGKLYATMASVNIFATLSKPDTTNATAEDLITEELTYSGGDWWDGSWSAKYDSTIDLTGSSYRGDDAIRVRQTTSNEDYGAFYVFDSAADLSNYSYMKIALNPGAKFFANYPNFYIGISESTTDDGGPELLYNIEDRGFTNNVWTEVYLPLNDPDVVVDGPVDLSNINSVYMVYYGPPTGQGGGSRIDGIQFGGEFPPTIHAGVSSSSTVSLTETDVLTENMTMAGSYPTIGSGWYEGYWFSAFIALYGDYFEIETSEITAGAQGIKYVPNVQPGLFALYEFTDVQLGVYGVNLSEFSGFTFDAKMPADVGGTFDITVYDYNAWTMTFDNISIPSDGNWNEYEIVFANYTDKEDLFDIENVWVIEIITWDITTLVSCWLDNFSFTGSEFSGRINASLSRNNINASITKPDIHVTITKD